ncbi:MAG: hypothetical protein ACLQSR_09815, partial [Limisphaerales bacterium]
MFQLLFFESVEKGLSPSFSWPFAEPSRKGHKGVANVQGLTSVENHRLERRAGQFEARVTRAVRGKIAWLLEL